MHFRRLLRKPLLACLLVIAASSGCAYRSLIYNNLEWLILYQVDSYLDLNSVQKQQLKLPIHETLHWFKAQRLPQLILMLKESRELAAKRAIDSVYLDKKLAILAAWRAEITEKLVPPISLLLHNLNAEQLEQLQKKIEKGNAPLTKLLARSESEFPGELADYAADGQASLKFWIGKFRPEQEQLMIRALALDRPTLTEQLKQRKRVQEYWQTLIKSNELPALVQAVKLSSVIDGGWNDPEYQRFRQQAKDRSRRFMHDLFASLDTEQWAHLEKTLDDLAAEMQAFGLRKN